MSVAKTNRMLLLGLLTLALLACTGRSNAVFRDEFLAMGTLVSVSLYGVEEARVPGISRQIRDDFNYMDGAWHPWKAGPLGRVNELLPLQGRFSLPPSLKPVLLQARELSRQSEGLFNPAIGALVKLWGFHRDEAPTGPPPSAAAIAELVAQKPSMDDLHIEGFGIRSDNPAVLLDFGGFAKGYAIDRVIERLKSLGIDNVIVNAGGDLRAIGSKGDEPWRIGVRHPRAGGVLASLEIRGDESVFTSGDYERFYEYQGRRYHHIIDPRSGYPARDFVSVTVVHASAAVADAASTALFVAGKRDWRRIAARMGVAQVMLVDAQGEIMLTPAMAERIHFEVEPRPPVRVESLP